MRVRYRKEGSVEASHRHLSVWVDGANIGRLTVRAGKEERVLQAIEGALLAIDADDLAAVEAPCSGCGHDVDRDTCWCGMETDQHSIYDGHSPVPMGCTCGYGEAEAKR